VLATRTPALAMNDMKREIAELTVSLFPLYVDNDGGVNDAAKQILQIYSTLSKLVVLSDEIRGRFDLVKNGETGFIYPCGDIDMLAGILKSTLKDRVKLAELSRAAMKRMETWSPRENIEATVLAVERASVKR